MKYIRVFMYNEDSVFEVIEEYNETVKCKLTVCENGYIIISKNDIIKESNTIEELCDEFVYIKDGVINQYLTIDFKHKREDEYCSLKNKLTANGIAEISKGISKYELENGELKFAIWTGKGLIYVAKINEKGELELI